MMTNKKKTLIGSAVLVLAIAGRIYWWTPAPTKATPAADAVAAAAKSGDYASVGKAIADGKLKPEEVREAVGKEFESQAIIRVNDYYAAGDAAAKQKVLDKAIDDMEKYRKEEAKRRNPTTSPSKTPATKPSTGDSLLRVAAWAISQPPDTRARLAEFHAAMEKRRAERGLPSVFAGGASLPLGNGAK